MEEKHTQRCTGDKSAPVPRKSGIPARKIAAVVLWMGLILLCLRKGSALTADGIAALAPENPWLAASGMLLFALKSLSVVLYSGLLYTADGLLFSLPVAVCLNFVGTAVMVSIPYWLGRREGTSALERIRARYPKTERLHTLRQGNDLLLSFLARMLRLPSDVVSLYLGAACVDYGKFLAGSLLGLLPHMVAFPVLGMGVRNAHAPGFVICLCVEGAYALITTLVCVRHRKRTVAGGDPWKTGDKRRTT